MMRRFLIVSTLICALYALKERPSIGIIRWDAWNQVDGQYDEISFFEHRAMSPLAHHYKLPFYATELSPTNVSYNADSQSIMDSEILFGRQAGIDYWAFDTYCKFGPNCTTNSDKCKYYYETTSNRYCPRNPEYSLDLYFNSKYQHLINFTLILLGSVPCDENAMLHNIALMKRPGFQTVLGGRPLLYLFQFSNGEAVNCGGSWEGSRSIFDKFRNMAKQEGLQNPYMVLMDFDPATVKRNAEALGFDAISTYALPGGTPQGVDFVEQVRRASNWWDTAEKMNAKVVPLAPTGWDPRPRFESKVPYVEEGPEHYKQATVEEIQGLVKSAIQWSCAHKAAAEAQTVIIYAWNEVSENGGCLIPNIGNGTAYVDGLSKVLPMYCP
ncbi:penE [Acrasis kona]|uniref:PenE n=1 Tax=Acrasis kona TaxID=1008807 RepID=A0AAW2ZBK6_9EUKA